MICGTCSEKTITNNNVFITVDKMYRQSLGYLIIPQIECFQIKETTTLIMELSVKND